MKEGQLEQAALELSRALKIIIGDIKSKPNGMEELTDKFIQTMTGNCEHEAYCQREDCKWKGMIVCCTVQNEAKQCAKIAFEYFAPPPAPIKTEELAEVFASSKYHGAKDETSELWLAAYDGFKAGYSASLPQLNGYTKS